MLMKSLRLVTPVGRLANHGRHFHHSPRVWETCAAPQPGTAAARPVSVFRTSEMDPGLHNEQHEGLHYSISPSDLKTIFPHGLPCRFQQQIKTFNEACIMVRQPALELLAYLKAANYSHPAIRYVVHGQRGCGKTLTLCNAVHFCAKQDWLILHVPNAYLWVKHCKELMQSSYKQARFDQPLEASVWLKNFRITNERFLKQLKTQQKYIWSKREVTEEGRPLAEVVDQGLTRVKNASDAVGILFKELKAQCLSDTYRMLVAIDGVNALWGPTTMKKEDRSQVLAGELTLIHNLKKLVNNDWSGGAVVTTLTQTGALGCAQLSHLPFELLRKEGFDAMDPFVPVEVKNYSQKEFESCYHYYIDRKWIQHEKACTEEGKKELIFLCNYNPGILDRICGPL
ncbi:28S ribosomal protein S29, mitochondrial [Carcharodon carcharias]|uniref:28S ribosomal protein S29, mitochondrial n=1 Tax=Carcharodon carcharias TaxID=13397 RepID=UPI001B7E5A19|nr:28S ribosomal protein S29, mitochondrial [Carcharodon carcharias]XP_041035613.1 28S ribosomal protein S29, mitochondrial [Carcharodon carcharias]XP_041035614.1 28S ribosomal protein S29, mitochondrial [Carcharodon carcharias]